VVNLPKNSIYGLGNYKGWLPYSYKKISAELEKHIGKGVITEITAEWVFWINGKSEIEKTKYSALRGRIDRAINH